MRKFSFLALVASLFVVQSFAQPRDLFAEFEAEAEASQSSEAVVTAPSSSSVPAPASSASVSSSSAKPATPASSASVSSSSAPVLSSSSSVSSSSVAPVASSSSVAPVSSSAEVSSSSAMSSSSVAVVDTLVQDSSTVADTAVAPADSAAPVPADSVAPADSLKADSAVVASVSSSSVVAAAPSSSSMSRRELLGPVKVSKVNGIDEMKGKYKSPRKALFMSLVIPGSGQMYVGGSKFTYARGAVYLALEAALWSGWYYYSVYKYDKQVNRYKKYAKQHYSIGAYENEMRTIYNTYASAYEDEFSTRYLGSRESFCEGIFGTATIHGCYNKDQLYHDDIEYEKDFVKNPKSLGEEMESIKFDSPSEIYQLIADDTYVLGWDDVDAVTPSSLNLQDPNSETVSLGTSSHQKEYRSMRSKANDYADMQAWFFGGLILNHIISAVDAAFTANSHNKALYEEDLSWYDHLHFDSGFSFADGLGVNVQASWGF